MAANGRLPASDLAPIAGGHLRTDAAAAWNAMNAESQRRYGVTLLPLGPASSYRTYAQQLYLWDHVAHPHDTNWVARPGTSNHGLGLAVDLANPHMRWIVDQIGAKYGWAKRWSDAPGEWWHIKWRAGVWKPAPSGPPKLHTGSRGVWVSRLQNLLQQHRVAGAPRTTGYFGPATLKAVKRYQKKHGLPATGVVGPRTWALLRR